MQSDSLSHQSRCWHTSIMIISIEQIVSINIQTVAKLHAIIDVDLILNASPFATIESKHVAFLTRAKRNFSCQIDANGRKKWMQRLCVEVSWKIDAWLELCVSLLAIHQSALHSADLAEKSLSSQPACLPTDWIFKRITNAQRFKMAQEWFQENYARVHNECTN